MKPIDFPSCESCMNRSNSVFCKLPQDELQQLSNCKGCNHYNRGQFLFAEGARPTGVFCISEGIIKLYNIGSDGKPQITRLAGPGDVVGHEAVFTQTNYKNYAEVVEPALVCFIPKNHFLHMLKENFNLSATVMKLLSEDLTISEKRITSMATKQVRERLAECLLVLQEFYLAKNKGDQAVHILLSREELASFAGTATETVVRTLADFVQDKIISIGKRSIKIENQAQLVLIAERYDS